MLSARRFWRMSVAGLLTVCGLIALPVLGYAAKTEKELIEERRVVARWHLTGHGQFQEAHRLGLDVWEEHLDPRTGYFTVMITDAQLAQLQQAGYQIEVMEPDYYRAQQKLALVPNGGFRTNEQCIALMDSIHTAYPAITTAKFSIGLTYEGQPMWAMKISDNPDVDENEPEVFFNGMHHAREPIGMEVCLETMKRLTSGYGPDTLITRLVNEREIYFLPIINVDGYEWNRMNWPDGGGMWRKNRQENFNGTYGVDLNRNYGYNWGYDDNGSSPNPEDYTYRGTAAFSEPENANMRAFINSRHFVFVLNYHSYSNLYLWPWGYDYIYTPDEAFFSAVGESLAAYNGFTPQVGWMLYPTNGDADDWGYGATTEHAKIYTFTPEVGTWAEGGFWPDPFFIPAQIAKCQGPNLVIIELADTPERIYPPAMPAWVSPTDTVGSGNYTLGWSDPGGLNAAVAFKLDELFGAQIKVDSAESGTGNWVTEGFTLSTLHAASPTHSFFGGYADGLRNRLTAVHFYRVGAHDTLKTKIWYDIELNWDYAYVEVSTDGGAHFTPIAGSITTGTNPYGNNRGNGITGSSAGALVNAKFPLVAFAGQDVLFRLSYETDEATLGAGVFFDDIGPVQAYSSIVTLAAATPATTYPVSGKSLGSYQYQLRSTDAQGQKSKATAPRKVSVYYLARGDMDNDGSRDVIDVTQLIDYVFSGGPGAVLPGAEECNCIPGVDVMDLVMLIDYAFRGGAEPICP